MSNDMQRAIFASIQSANSYSRPAPAPRPAPRPAPVQSHHRAPPQSFSSQARNPVINRSAPAPRRSQGLGGASVGTGGHGGRLAREGILPVAPKRSTARTAAPPFENPDQSFAKEGCLKVPKSYMKRGAATGGRRPSASELPEGWDMAFGRGNLEVTDDL